MNDVVPHGSPFVPLLDLKAQYRPLRESIEAAIREVCDSQYFIGGAKVSELEERIARYSHCRFGIGVSSGTDALLIALMALDIGLGHEVVTSTYSFFATGGVIARLGARPIFCDIDPASYNLSADSVADFLHNGCRKTDGKVVNLKTGGTVKAIIPVHLYGQMADMASIIPIAAEYGISVIEDAAQAIGAELPDGRRAGSLGNFGCFSFFPSKNLGAFGDAGMCVTQSPELADKCKTLRVHGAEPKYHHSIVGGNFRLDAVQAAVLLVKLKHLDMWTKARQENAARYDKRLNELKIPLITPVRVKNCRHIYNQYVIESDDRDNLRAFLADRGIGTEVYYPVPLHMQKCFSDLGYRQGDCPKAERAAQRTLALPIYPELSVDQQNYVIEQIHSFFQHRC